MSDSPRLEVIQLRYADHYARRLADLGRRYNGGGQQAVQALAEFSLDQAQLKHAFHSACYRRDWLKT